MKVTLTRENFKWSRSPFWWAGVFVGSNDFITDQVKEDLQSIEGPVYAISLIGGLGFFRAMPYIQDLRRITWFDRNINEIGKLSRAMEYISKTDFSDFRWEAFAEYIAGQGLDPYKSAITKDISLSLYPCHSVNGILGIASEHAWLPSPWDYAAVRGAIPWSEQEAYSDLPFRGYDGPVVVYLSNTSDFNDSLNDDIVRDRILAKALYTIRCKDDMMYLTKI